MAHHWKQKRIQTPVELDEALEYCPTTEPRIYQEANRDVWYLFFREKDQDGKSSIRRKIFKFKGKKLTTKEEAEKCKNEIWDKYQHLKSQNEYGTN